MLTVATGATWTPAFEVKWLPHVNAAYAARRCFATLRSNLAQVSGEQDLRLVCEREMTSDFREELVALLPRLRRFAFTLTGNLDQADDLVQQACEKALVKQAQWQEGTRLDSWLYRIIQNAHIDSLRKQGRRSEHLHEDSVDELVDASSKALPERENLLSVTAELIQQLPEEQRAVMLLVAVEEHSYREAAETLQIPVGTVMSRLARARTRIIAMLEGLTPAATEAQENA